MVRFTTTSMSPAASRSSTVCARTPNSAARAFAASMLMSATARISKPLNSGPSRRYAAEMLPQPMMPTPRVVMGGCLQRVLRKSNDRVAKRTWSLGLSCSITNTPQGVPRNWAIRPIQSMVP